MAKVRSTLQTIQGWKPIAIKTVNDRIIKLKVRDTGYFINTIKLTVKSLGLNSVQAEWIYAYYAIFPDMGVGKGQSADDVAVNKLAGGTRKKKPWSRALAGQNHRFAELAAESIADNAVEQIADSLLVKRSIKIDM